MQPDKLKKLVEEGKITNDNGLLAFEVLDALEGHLEGIQGKLDDTIQAIKDIPQPEKTEIPEMPLMPDHEPILKEIRDELRKPLEVNITLELE